MSERHINIPIFIPHMGCPNQCVFCNQRTISGVNEFSVSSVVPQIEGALSTIDDTDTTVEIAFFGGSFTGIDYSLMCELLQIAHSYIKNGKVESIRVSTRPDYINDVILDTLEKYGVKTIELGLQSMDDNVLLASKRGHTSQNAIDACQKIVERGFYLVGQMMIGLPSSTLENEIYTAKKIVECGAKGARIYPTVVLQQTELKDYCTCGIYEPLSVDGAVYRSKEVMKIFIDNNIDVIRIGLHASENLVSSETYYAGPNHSALGELVYGELYYDIAYKALSELSSSLDEKEVIISVPKGAVSKAVGQKKKNIIRLKQKFNLVDIKFVQDSKLADYQIKINLRTDNKCT